MAEPGPCLACSVTGCRHRQALVPSSVELQGVKGEATGTPCLLRPCLHHMTPSVTYKGHPSSPSKLPPLLSPLPLASALTLILAPRSPSHAPQGPWSPVPQTQHPEGRGVFLFLSIRSRPLSPGDALATWMEPRSELGLREDEAGGPRSRRSPLPSHRGWTQGRARRPIRSLRAQTGGQVSQEGPIEQMAGQLRALAAPHALHLPTPSHLPQRATMLLNRQKPNLLLHRDFCEVRGLNSPEVFARFGADSG